MRSLRDLRAGRLRRGRSDGSALRLRVDIGVDADVDILAVDLKRSLLIAPSGCDHKRLAAGTRRRLLKRDADHEHVAVAGDVEVFGHSDTPSRCDRTPVNATPSSHR